MNSEELKALNDSLWKSADDLRANSDLTASEYSTPVMGLIFLKFADNKYRKYEDEILTEYKKLKGTRREKPLHEIAIEKCGFYLPEHARYKFLLNLPEDKDADKALKKAMASIEEYKSELNGVLPQDEYFRLTRTDKSIPKRLLQTFQNIPEDVDGDLFGQIYEYFLSEFALAEGQSGGTFFTPRSVVRLMVEIIEPHDGTVFDPACGSGGMFVQSAAFVESHRKAQEQHASDVLFVYGQEKTLEYVKLAKMNLVVNGLRGDIRQANTYYEDLFDSFGKFNYVLANPPFNVDEVNLGKVEKDKRFNTYGIPRNKTKVKKKDAGAETVPNANYLWINLFATSLKPKGRAALVMANSASDARHSEADIRKKLIENNLIYGMLTLPSNMFWTVTLPATLWFFDKNKKDERILFIDARNIFKQIDRAHREFTPEQIKNIGIISRLHKGRREEFIHLVDEYFASGMNQLAKNASLIPDMSAQLLTALDDSEGQKAIKALTEQWQGWDKLQKVYQIYLAKSNTKTTIEACNKSQHKLQELFEPFFTALHEGLKNLHKIVRGFEKMAREANGNRGAQKNLKAIKEALEKLESEIKEAEEFFGHVHWLQEHFPNAEYEDVTGLCKLANLKDIEEQDYSLNPGRYVGVVIEEDGKTEEEFIEELLVTQNELSNLIKDANMLDKVIAHNLKQLAGDV
ncbi:MAG TPA: class I SAM-dependent DNA methyltransferase [Anaerolineales bacterium]|nr:class I SAM-dependent DNA methyltransferase [Anaerolineales bacterium]